MGNFGGGGGGYVAPVSQPAAPRVAALPMTVVPETTGPEQFITADAAPTDPSNQNEFVREARATVPGIQDDDLTMVLGSEGVERFISPFETQRAGASFLGSEYADASGLPRIDRAVVPNQNVDATGQGGEGFGTRALFGGEAGEIENPMPEGSMEQTDMVSTEMASDIATNNEQPLPGQALNNDEIYRMATSFGGGLGNLTPGYGPQALRAGAFGKNLLNQRSTGLPARYDRRS
tara:strand:+ start:14742 stop:15443 length:702 start_codon:yes stop_codon:yes gene_type:complete